VGEVLERDLDLVEARDELGGAEVVGDPAERGAPLRQKGGPAELLLPEILPPGASSGSEGE
jgi:hypothetical protein